MDRRKIIVIAFLIAVIVVAVAVTAERTWSELTAPPFSVDQKITKFDMKSLEAFAETRSDWENKYAPDTMGRYKNPKTGEYTMVDADVGGGTVNPVPQTPAGVLPKPGTGTRPGARGRQAMAAASDESLLSALAIGPARPPPAIKYNLLVISVDTCRADHLKCYGYKKDTSPHLDQLAKEGVLFEDVTAAASWTVPSHMSMFTSLYPSVHGVQNRLEQLSESAPTLAQCLAKSGYATAAFVTGPVLNRFFGFNRGFQLYDDFTVSPIFLKRGGVNNVVTDPLITNLATQWLQKHSHENFFLFLHYWDCHNDYVPPAPFDKKFDPGYKGKETGRFMFARQDDIIAHISVMDLAHMVALYDGGIAFTDEHVGKVLQLLQDLGLSEKTLVVVLSDHGEGFLEHGKLLHCNSLYEEAVHVPLIMRLPGVIPAGKRVAGNVSHVDLLPTVLGLLQVAGPLNVQGADLSPAILGDQPVPERLIYSELKMNGFNLRAIRWGDHKLLGAMGTLAGAQLEEVADGREKVIADADLKKDCPEAALRAFTEGPPLVLETKTEKTIKPDTELLKQLKSLGYTE